MLIGCLSLVCWGIIWRGFGRGYCFVILYLQFSISSSFDFRSWVISLIIFSGSLPLMVRVTLLKFSLYWMVTPLIFR